MRDLLSFLYEDNFKQDSGKSWQIKILQEKQSIIVVVDYGMLLLSMNAISWFLLNIIHSNVYTAAKILMDLFSTTYLRINAVL